MLPLHYILASLLSLSATVMGCSTPDASNYARPEAPTPAIPLGENLWQSYQAPSKDSVPASQPRLNFRVNQLPANHLLEVIHQELGYGYEVDECGQNPVSLIGAYIPLENVFEALRRQASARIHFKDGQIRLECDTETMRIYPLDYLAISRKMQDQSSLHSNLEVTSAQNARRTGNQSEFTLTNLQHHDVWKMMVNQVEQLLSESRSIKETRRERLVEATSDKDYANNRGLKSTTDSSNSKLDATVTRQQTLSGKVIANPESASLTVIATEEQHKRIEKWLNKVQEGLLRQVAVDAVIAEVRLNESYQKGIDWAAFQRGGLALGLTVQGLDLPNPALTLNISQQSDKSDTSLILRLLEEFGSTSVISSPRIVALNQQAAVLKLIDNRVFFTTDLQTSAPTSNNPAFTTFQTQVQTVPVGFLMTVTPLITSTGQVQLRIRPTLTRIVGFVSDPNPALAERDIVSQVPEIQTRELESILLLNDGELALLGGLKQISKRYDSNGIPHLPDSLDLITKSQNTQEQQTELVIMLKARILDTNTPKPSKSEPSRLSNILETATDLKNSQPKAALRYLALANEPFPESPEIALNLSILHARLKQTKQALEQLERALTLCPLDKCDLPILQWQAILETLGDE